jgi:hypothetical protein
MKILIIITSFIICSTCFAGKKVAKKMNSEKLCYQDYIDQYGINDTSKAIINFYFDKRELSAAGKMSFLPLSMVLAIVVPTVGLGLMAISSPLFVSGVITRKKYNNKNLIKELNNYNENNILSKKMEKIIVYLLEEEELYNDELLNSNLVALD